jgi:UDP-glucose 4-epimerase
VGETSINKLADKIILQSNSSSKIRHIPYSEVYPVGFEDIHRRIPNTEKIRSEIGWAPRKNLAEIIEDVIVELKTNPE